MYKFVFYFFYRTLLKLNDDTIFTAKLGVAIVLCLHLISLANILKFFGLIDGIPIFSDIYLFNKLYWYPFIIIIIGLILLNFNKVKTKAIIEKYSANDNFYSIGNILLFLLLIVIPVLIIIKIK